MKNVLKQTKNSYGFTLIEMIFCVSVILVILLLVIPNVTSKNNLVKDKSCDAQVEVVNSQIVLYEIDTGHLPTSISQLTSGAHPYLTRKQATCPNHKSIHIADGEAYAS
jgi:prepilin-type N-terminal cleavage/methylation domain-containing protein